MSTRYGHEGFSSPAVGHVCGGPGTLQAVDGGLDGVVRWWTVYNPDGSQGCSGSFNTGPGGVQSSPVLYDFNGDGYDDVLVANTANSYRTKNTRGRVVVFSPHQNNKVLFSVHTGDAKHHIPGDFATPVVYDLNGQPDIIETSYDEHLHVWDERTGKNLRGSPFALPDTSWSSPTVAVVDGAPQIFFGDDCAGVRGQHCYPHHGGYVYDMRYYQGHLSLKWRHFLSGETVWSSPALAHLSKNGPLDVVVGTGTMPCTRKDGMCGGRHVYAMNASNGRMLRGWPVNTAGLVMASPAVGNLEIGRPGLQIAVLDNEGNLYVFGSRGGHPIFKKCLPAMLGMSCARGDSYHGSPTMADIGGNRDIVVPVGQHIVIMSGHGRHWLYNLAYYLHSGSGCTGHSYGPFTGAPTVASLGGTATVIDGAVCKGSKSAWRAGLFVWNLHKSFVSTTSMWPTFKRGFGRNALEG